MIARTLSYLDPGHPATVIVIGGHITISISRRGFFFFFFLPVFGGVFPVPIAGIYDRGCPMCKYKC